MKLIGAWAVHVLTASGAAIALGAAIAAAHGEWQLVFLLLGIAMIIDGVDGPIARALDVRGEIPWFDGATLDLIVDYTTYVLIPAFVLAQSGLLTKPYAILAGIGVAIVGALYFSDTRMKTPTQAFRGFPGVWNAVVFMLMVFSLPEWLTLLILAALAVLSFCNVEFVHPVRVVKWRNLTLVMALVWAALAIWALADNLQPGPIVGVAFAAASLYFALVGAVQQFIRTGRGA